MNFRLTVLHLRQKERGATYMMAAPLLALTLSHRRAAVKNGQSANLGYAPARGAPCDASQLA